MYQVKCLNKISPLGTSRLGENYQVGEDVENPDAILVRSAAMHDMEFNKNLLAIACSVCLCSSRRLHNRQ